MSTYRLLPCVLAAVALIGTGCSSNKPAAPAEPPKAAETAPPPPPPPAPAAPTSAMVGRVTAVDPSGSSMTLRTSDGKEHKVEITPDTTVAALHDGVVETGKGAEAIVKTTAAEVKKGTMVAVRFTEKEGKLIAADVKRGSAAVVKESEVIIKSVDKEGRKVIVKTKDGAEHVYEVGKDATIATGNKIAEVGKATGDKLVEGTKATLHFSEQQGQKVIHFLKH